MQQGFKRKKPLARPPSVCRNRPPSWLRSRPRNVPPSRKPSAKPNGRPNRQRSNAPGRQTGQTVLPLPQPRIIRSRSRVLNTPASHARRLTVRLLARRRAHLLARFLASRLIPRQGKRAPPRAIPGTRRILESPLAAPHGYPTISPNRPPSPIPTLPRRRRRLPIRRHLPRFRKLLRRIRKHRRLLLKRPRTRCKVRVTALLRAGSLCAVC